jgi:acetyl-CoA carboxylase carboxyltransferase component
MVNAVANSVVPKFTFIIGNSYGAGNYAMCGKAYDPRLIYAWPSAKIAVMGGVQAAKTLMQIQSAGSMAREEEEDTEKQERILKEITERYEKQTTPYYAAARLWVDGVIDPLKTREIISIGIEAANQSPIVKKFNVGIIQT